MTDLAETRRRQQAEWEEAVAALRREAVRTGRVPPRTDDERAMVEEMRR